MNAVSTQQPHDKTGHFPLLRKGCHRTRAFQVVALIACALSAHLALAVENNEPPTSQAIYDASQWTRLQSATATFGKTMPSAEVILLKSIQPTGSSGSNEPVYTVNLLVVAAGKVVYSFAPLAVPPRDDRRVDPVFLMDDAIDVRDVNGDGIPEVMFRAGFQGASDWGSDTHILQLVAAGPSRFRDIRATQFFDSWWDGVRFLDLGRRTLVVVAQPVDPPIAPGDFVSHGEPRFHKYAVYEWSRKRRQFVVTKTIRQTGKLHESAADALDADWPYIIMAVNR